MLVEELERTETEEGRTEAGKIKVEDSVTKFQKLRKITNNISAPLPS
jgi:hypothetical protein